MKYLIARCLRRLYWAFNPPGDVASYTLTYRIWRWYYDRYLLGDPKW
jgi:hypothetical protein